MDPAVLKWTNPVRLVQLQLQEDLGQKVTGL